MMNKRKAVSEINKAGILLVFPVNNQKEPASLWSAFFPRSRMRWEWDNDGDDRVASLWHLMKELSDGRQVVYSKWYKGRATFFSRSLFTALLKTRATETHEAVLTPTARHVLEVLEMDSPLSTKQLKKMTGLQGRDNEGAFNRATKELFSNFLIVGFGEVDDGAFPSLALGATKLLYEDLWNEAGRLGENDAQSVIDRFMPPGSLVRKQLERQNHPAAMPRPALLPRSGRL